MTKTELINQLSYKHTHLTGTDVESSVKIILEQISETLGQGQRIEIRGFGSFSLHRRPQRLGRNPRTGQSVVIAPKCRVHFKPGKELRQRVNYPSSEG